MNLMFIGVKGDQHAAVLVTVAQGQEEALKLLRGVFFMGHDEKLDQLLFVPPLTPGYAAMLSGSAET